MSSVFLNLKKYEQNWTVVSLDSLDAEDISLINYAEVVKSTYGSSLKFIVPDGSFYIPIDNKDEHYHIGDRVDLTRVIVKTLRKDGENDIQRIVFKDEGPANF